MKTAFGIPLGFVSVEITVEVMFECTQSVFGEMKVRKRRRVIHSSLLLVLVTLN